MTDDQIEVAIRQRAKNDPKWLLSALVAANNDKLIAAAKKVVDIRYSNADWDELNQAIGDLGCLLKSQGVKCNGIA